jgi:hypothetical protein
MFANMQRQLCELKLAAELLKNHATALCVGSLTNTFTQFICQNCRLRNRTNKPLLAGNLPQTATC